MRRSAGGLFLAALVLVSAPAGVGAAADLDPTGSVQQNPAPEDVHKMASSIGENAVLDGPSTPMSTTR